MHKRWFKLNRLKIGWVPVAWQGWILSVGYFGLIIYTFILIDRTSHSVSDTLFAFLPLALLFSGLFSVICYFTSEKADIE